MTGQVGIGFDSVAAPGATLEMVEHGAGAATDVEIRPSLLVAMQSGRDDPKGRFARCGDPQLSWDLPGSALIVRVSERDARTGIQIDTAAPFTSHEARRQAFVVVGSLVIA